jgi:hypothetical protein
VLENNSIRDPLSGLPKTYARMYSVMAGEAGPVELKTSGLDADVQLGAPLAFQTAVARKIGDFWGTLVWARERHAASVELPADGQYPISGGGGSPPWQTIAEVAQWFQDQPALSAPALAGTEGQATTGAVVASLTLDELAALDTMAGYGDVGSVPFDSVSAVIAWPDGVVEPALVTDGSSAPSPSFACPAQRWCGVVVDSGGHAPLEEAQAVATITVSLTVAGVAYVPAAGANPVAAPAIAVSDAGLSVTSFQVKRALAPLEARLTALFADADPWGRSSDFTLTVDWGDGSTTVVGARSVTGGFLINTTHAFAAAGTYQVGLTVQDAGGSAASASQSVAVR